MRKIFELRYRDGSEVRKNDRVLVYPKRHAVVEAILRPGSKRARDYDVDKEGGFILRFDDGDVQVWLSAQDEIELIRRQS